MDVKVGLAGATGALGGEILKVLDKSPWRPKTVVPSASDRTTVDAVEYGESRLAVEDLAHEDLAALDVLILAVPADVARPIVQRAVADGVIVVDTSASIPGLPLVVPWINPEVLAEARAVAIPDAAALLLASVLGPLARAGITGDVDATVLLPASSAGRAGIDELSKQVVALFNSGTPPRKVFDGGLAFDLAPLVGTPDEAGWTDRERSSADAARAVSGWEGEIRVTLVLAPLFSGVSATLSLRPRRRVLADLAVRVLTDGGVRVGGTDAKTVPRPRKVDGRPFAHVGRVRASPAGDHLALWVTLDNLQTAAAAAVGAAGAMARRTG